MVTDGVERLRRAQILASVFFAIVVLGGAVLWWTLPRSFPIVFSFDTMTWTKEVVLNPSQGSNVAVEPSVLYDGSPQILVDRTSVFKMWYRQFDQARNRAMVVCYAESGDGKAWVKYSGNPVLNDSDGSHPCPFVLRHNGTFFLYVHCSEMVRIDRYVSSNGLRWTKDKVGALVLGARGSWDDGNLGNVCVWVENSHDWKMIYEAKSSMEPWKLGYATSEDGKNWTKYPHPVLQDTGSCGGPYVYKLNETYYMWYHCCANKYGLPTDICLAASRNLITWTKHPKNPVLNRTEAWEGSAGYEGQVADPSVLLVEGSVWIWYSTVPNQTPPPDQCIALATSMNPT
jgi:predicted GH43/DUF377 family glycosyl hydrolase